MIPTYLSSNPFPDSHWSPDLRPVAVLDGAAQGISTLDNAVSVDVAYFVGVNHKEL